MLELYQHGSSTCAAKARFLLMEKELAYRSHYVDILKGEQFRPEYLALNPMAVVPTLVHDGAVVIESTVICEYIEDAFPRPRLRPVTALDAARMRMWTKAVDELLQPAVKYITYAACHRHILKRLPPEKFEQYMRGPQPSGADSRVPGDPDWAQSKRAIVEHGIDAPGVAAKFRLYDRYFAKMDEALAEAPWLAGSEFSLADISLAPYANRFDMLGMSEMWASRPRLAGWFERVKARPTFKPCFIDFCPPDLARDLRTFGAQSWPEVRRALRS